MMDKTTSNTPIKIFNCSNICPAYHGEISLRTISHSSRSLVTAPGFALLPGCQQAGCIRQLLPHNCDLFQGLYNKQTNSGTELSSASSRRICQPRSLSLLSASLRRISAIGQFVCNVDQLARPDFRHACIIDSDPRKGVEVYHSTICSILPRELRLILISDTLLSKHNFPL